MQISHFSSEKNMQFDRVSSWWGLYVSWGGVVLHKLFISTFKLLGVCDFMLVEHLHKIRIIVKSNCKL